MTTTAQSLKLRRKSGRTLDLTAVPYAIGRNFKVPAVNPIESIAYGSSANTYGGGVLSSVKYNDRTWSFEIRILNTTEASVRLAARRVDDFVKNDPLDTLYIDYRPSTDTPEPLWGQYGVAFEYEVVSASRVELYDEYADALLRERASFITINVVIKPFAHGKQQLACIATGGVIEDKIGSADGRSRALVIPEATTNLATNPVFGNATWNTGWTAAASLVATQNTDKRYLLYFTQNSAQLTAVAATNNTFTLSLTLAAVAHTVTAIIKLPEGDTPSATHMQIHYNGSEITTTFTATGDGFYYASAPITGTAGAAVCGVTVKNGYTVYLQAIQVEAKAYGTYLCTGDMLGCAWSGTAHASTSVRTVSSCKLPFASSKINSTHGSVRVIVRFDVSDAFAANMVLLDARDAGAAATSLILHWVTADNKFYAQWGGVSVTSSAQTFSAGTTFVIYATWGSAGLKLYVNGAADGTGAFAYVAPQANIFIGSIYSAAFHTVGQFKDVEFYNEQLTATQVTNDYANILPLISAGDTISSIPFFWTLGGDGVLSLTASHQPLGIVAGVPGSAPALSEIHGTLSSQWLTIKSLVLSNYAIDDYLPITAFLHDMSGTAEGADPEYGDAHLVTTVNGGADVIANSATLVARICKAFNRAELTYFGRLLGSAATQLYLYSSSLIGNVSIDSKKRAITPATAYRFFRTKPIVFGFDEFTNDTANTVIFRLVGEKIATNVDISVDYFAILPKQCLIISGGDVPSVVDYKVRGTSVAQIDTGMTTGTLQATGDVIEFAPNKINHLQSYLCPDETVNPLISYTNTITAIYITPRWALL